MCIEHRVGGCLAAMHIEDCEGWWTCLEMQHILFWSYLTVGKSTLVARYAHKIATAELGHLSCIPFVCMTCKVQQVLIIQIRL